MNIANIQILCFICRENPILKSVLDTFMFSLYINLQTSVSKASTLSIPSKFTLAVFCQLLTNRRQATSRCLFEEPHFRYCYCGEQRKTSGLEPTSSLYTLATHQVQYPARRTFLKINRRCPPIDYPAIKNSSCRGNRVFRTCVHTNKYWRTVWECLNNLVVYTLTGTSLQRNLSSPLSGRIFPQLRSHSSIVYYFNFL